MENKKALISKDKITGIKQNKFNQCCVSFQEQTWFC